MTFVMNERSGNTQIDAAARVDVDAPIARHHALARQAELRMARLVAKPILDGVDRLLDRNKAFHLFSFE
jgi:hypothetical protein